MTEPTRLVIDPFCRVVESPDLGVEGDLYRPGGQPFATRSQQGTSAVKPMSHRHRDNVRLPVDDAGLGVPPLGYRLRSVEQRRQPHTSPFCKNDDIGATSWVGRMRYTTAHRRGESNGRAGRRQRLAVLVGHQRELRAAGVLEVRREGPNPLPRAVEGAHNDQSKCTSRSTSVRRTRLEVRTDRVGDKDASLEMPKQAPRRAVTPEVEFMGGWRARIPLEFLECIGLR